MPGQLVTSRESVAVLRSGSRTVTDHFDPLLRWVPAIGLPMVAWLWFGESLDRWQRMWLLALAIYAGCKWLTWWPLRAEPVGAARHLGYLLAWPGMNAKVFLRGYITKERRPGLVRAGLALGKMLLGAALLLVAAVLVDKAHWLLVAWIGMAGVAFVLHFGLFDLMSVLWRRAGVDAQPLMVWPCRATGLADYWGRRWNTAFRDLSHGLVFQPVARRWGARGATLAVFIVSGLVHDLVISLPAGAGFGGPTLFFAVQAGGLFAERSRDGRRLGLGAGLRGWLFAMLVLAAPLPLLFHGPFLREIVLAMLQELHAWL